MNTRRTLAVVGAAVAVSGLLAGCGGDETSAAYDACETELVDRYGTDGFKRTKDVSETDSPPLVKVTGMVTYYTRDGAGDRVEAPFMCQFDKAADGGLSLRELSVKD